MHWLGHSVLQSEKNDDLQILVPFMRHTKKWSADLVYISFESSFKMVSNSRNLLGMQE